MREMDRSKVQVLYDACCAIFSQEGLPSFQQIQHVKTLMDKIGAIDVGIDEFGRRDSPFSSPESGGGRGLTCALAFSEITYIHIHECDHFSMGVFCFPEGKAFPLHDHPGMTVFSKVLYGSVHVRAYDWIKLDAGGCPTDGDRGIVGAGGLASKVIDAAMKAPQQTSVLFPRSGGNIHCFTALTPCAILDVLSPPYSQHFGRPSTYFSHFPIPSLPGYAWLEEKPLPGDLIVKGAPYLGPPVAADCDFCECGFKNLCMTCSVTVEMC